MKSPRVKNQSVVMASSAPRKYLGFAHLVHSVNTILRRANFFAFVFI